MNLPMKERYYTNFFRYEERCKRIEKNVFRHFAKSHLLHNHHAPVFTIITILIAELNNTVQPIFIQSASLCLLHQGNKQRYTPHEEVEESLSIMDKEKELIIKALKKQKANVKMHRLTWHQ